MKFESVETIFLISICLSVVLSTYIIFHTENIKPPLDIRRGQIGENNIGSEESCVLIDKNGNYGSC